MRSIIFSIIILFFSAATFAVNCDKNPSHPSCSSPPVEPSGLSITKVLVNRLADQIEISGSGLASAPVRLAGELITPSSSSDDILLILPFDSTLNTVVSTAGNYILDVDGVEFALYIDGAIADATITGCPCDFSVTLVEEALLAGTPNECIDTSTGDQSVLTSDYLATAYPVDFASPPVYIIEAAFVADNAGSSVCRMVKIDGSVTTLIRENLTDAQQTACADNMRADSRICAAPAP